MAELLPIPVFADIIQIIVFIVVIVFSILSQILNKEKPPQLKPRPRRKPVANPQQQPQQPKRPMETRIEDLIRRVSEPNQNVKPITDVEVLEANSLPQRPVVRGQRIQKRQRPAVDERPQTIDSLAQHLEVNVLGDSLQSRDSKLAKRIENRDEAMESHMKSVFDHQIGDLRQQADAVQSQKETISRITTNDIADLLRSPHDLRKAIIISEILSRPEDKW